MIIFVILATIIAVTSNLIYFKIKQDKLRFPVISAVIFSVITSILLYNNFDLLNSIKIFAVLSLLHICSTNDIIRHQSDDIFPLTIIIIGFIKPTSIIYMLISLAIAVVMFLIIIITSKNTIGGGDIKMICALSFFFGITMTATATVIACITGITYAIITKYAAKLPDFSKHFAFLPFVEVGYFIALLMQIF